MARPGTSESGFADINGARIYYEVAGDGHPLTLLHAGVADSGMWDDQFAPFAEWYRVIRYDVRGFGRSRRPPGPYSNRDDLHRLLGLLGVEKAYLVGLSLGGVIAIDFALEHAEMVDALILVASGLSGHQWSDRVRQFVSEEDAALELGDIPRAAELVLQMWVDGPTRTSDQVNPAVRERVREMQQHAFQHLSVESTPLPLEPPAISRLSDIDVPTLIVAGDLDVPDILEIADRLEVGIRGATKTVIPGVAHMVNMENPKEFNRIVLEFLRSI